MVPPAVVATTRRLRLRHMDAGDAAFILGLLNEPSFIAGAGDRGLRTLDDAARWIDTGPVASYQRNGFGVYLVELPVDGHAIPIGICGLVKRDAIDVPDIGFAIHQDRRTRGYALEAATAVLRHAREDLGLARLAAITSAGNVASLGLLGRLGLVPAGTVRIVPDGELLQVLRMDLGPTQGA